MTNPYAPPNAEVASDSVAETNRLLFIWIWIPTAIVGAMLATPVDFFSMLLAMAFALPCYLIGVIWGANFTKMDRVRSSVVCSFTAGIFAASTWYSMGLEIIVIAILFAIANVAMG